MVTTIVGGATFIGVAEPRALPVKLALQVAAITFPAKDS
jgi:hypothetical protein